MTLKETLESKGLYDAIWALSTHKDQRKLRLFAADCAERVLYLYEENYPNDKRPRKAIEAARQFARGEIDENVLAEAANAAEAASAAAWSFSSDAAAEAASATASQKPWTAAARAFDAARDALWWCARAFDAARDAVWWCARGDTFDADAAVDAMAAAEAAAAAAAAEKRAQEKLFIKYFC